MKQNKETLLYSESYFTFKKYENTFFIDFTYYT